MTCRFPAVSYSLVKTLTKTMTAALAVAGAALWGNGAMGQGTVTVTLSKNSKIVKVGGAISGTHGTLPSTWTVSGKMTGPDKGKITPTATTFSGTAGTTPSNTVDDTFVEITYTKKGEKPMHGKAALTVVGIVGKLSGETIDLSGRRAIVKVHAKGFPKDYSFGEVKLTFTADILEDNPFPVQTDKNIINFEHVFSSTVKFNKTRVTLSCPFGPANGRFSFGATAIFTDHGTGVDIK